MDNVFKTIKEDCSFELIEKKSKFLTNLFYISSKKEAEEKLEYVKKIYLNAKHYVFAYRVLEDSKVSERFSDDGEPSRYCR